MATLHVYSIYTNTRKRNGMTSSDDVVNIRSESSQSTAATTTQDSYTADIASIANFLALYLENSIRSCV
jgi:hypothetical protein